MYTDSIQPLNLMPLEYPGFAGHVIMNAASRGEAIEHAREFMALHTTHWPEWKGECESRQLVEL